MQCTLNTFCRIAKKVGSNGGVAPAVVSPLVVAPAVSPPMPLLISSLLELEQAASTNADTKASIVVKGNFLSSGNNDIVAPIC